MPFPLPSGRSTRLRLHQNGPQSGFAMFMALGALVIVAVLIAGSSYITTQEARLGQNQLVQSRALAAAEYGLNKIQADWDKTPNLQMPNGTFYDTNYTIANQGLARVRYVRLNNETFWIVSEGRATVGNSVSAARTAVKRVGAILRLRIPTIKANGAVTTGGDVTVKGSPIVNGVNTTPSGWTGCATGDTLNKAGLVVAPDAVVTIQKAGQVLGSPTVDTSELAADSNTYVRFGDETWTALVAQANLTLPGGAYGSAVAPVTASGSCDKSVTTNWGEPHRSGADYVAECINYFPIIYSSTTLSLNGNGRGQGVLLVQGDLTINGTFEWYGLIVVSGDVKKGNGTAKIWGGIMARSAQIDDDNEVMGNITINYSQCGLERAMRGSAQVVQAKHRAWTELY